MSMFLRGRSTSVPSASPVVLHEDQVVELDEALGAAVGGSPVLRRTAGPRSKNSSERRAAGAGVAHLPEVVLAQALDARRRDTPGTSSQMSSASSSVSCTVTHSRSASTPEDLGDQLPGEGDGVGLEVVTEAEVAEHLEERAVPVGGPDDVDVDGTEALLHRRGPGPAGGVSSPTK